MRLCRYASVLGLVCACSAPVPPAATEVAVKDLTLSVIAVNDVHGRIEQLPLLGGYVDNVRALRARTGGSVLVLDAGDMFQGTLESNLSEGAAVIDAYNALGVSAAAVGNHEFDFGPAGPRMVPLEPNDDPLGALSARVRQARFPMLSANLRQREGNAAAVPGVEPSILLWAGRVRVGVIGGLTYDALTLTHAANVRALQVTPLASRVAEQAARLRAAGAAVVIALVHAGGECKKTIDPENLDSCDQSAEVFELARALPKHAVDLIVGGHTHAYVAQLVAGIPIIESGALGRAFGRVDLTLEASSHALTGTRIYPPHALCEESYDAEACSHETYEGTAVTRAARVTTAIAPHMLRARELRAQPLGVEALSNISRASATESPLSNLVTDLMLRAFPGADAALNNGGAVRMALPKGPLTYGQLFETFPFDNVFAVLTLEARELSAIVARSLEGEHGIVALSGLRARATCKSDRLDVELFRPNGRPIAADTRLRVVTSDFIANLGDGLLRDVKLAPEETEIHRERLIRDALIDGLRALPGARIDGHDLRLYDPAHPRIEYRGSRPLRCD